MTLIFLLIILPVFSLCLESCDNEECLVAKLLDTRNATIDPCKDFYGYTCGNWEDKNPSTMTKKSLNVFDVLLEENQLILRKLLGKSGRCTARILQGQNCDCPYIYHIPNRDQTFSLSLLSKCNHSHNPIPRSLLCNLSLQTTVTKD